MLLPILVNARWVTPHGYTAVITTSAIPGCVEVALLDGDALMGTCAMAGTPEEAAEACTDAYTYLGPLVVEEPRVIVRVEDSLDLGALCLMQEAESMHALTHLTMPRRSMS